MIACSTPTVRATNRFVCVLCAGLVWVIARAELAVAKVRTLFPRADFTCFCALPFSNGLAIVSLFGERR